MVNHFSNDLDLLDLKYFLILQCYIYMLYAILYAYYVPVLKDWLLPSFWVKPLKGLKFLDSGCFIHAIGS